MKLPIAICCVLATSLLECAVADALNGTAKQLRLQHVRQHLQHLPKDLAALQDVNSTETKKHVPKDPVVYEAREKHVWEVCTKHHDCIETNRLIKQAFVKEYGSNNMSEKEIVDAAYKGTDGNKDGHVSVEEFMTHVHDLGVPDTMISADGYVYLFFIDMNEDGFVAKESFQRIFDFNRKEIENDKNAAKNEAHIDDAHAEAKQMKADGDHDDLPPANPFKSDDIPTVHPPLKKDDPSAPGKHNEPLKIRHFDPEDHVGHKDFDPEKHGDPLAHTKGDASRSTVMVSAVASVVALACQL